MTPRAMRRELHLTRLALQKACRVDTRYRQHIAAAIHRLDMLSEAVNLDRPKPGPKKGGQP